VNVTTLETSCAFRIEACRGRGPAAQGGEAVRAALARGARPLDPSPATATPGWARSPPSAPPDVGAVWFDAHGDFNTPDTSPSGYFDGMALAHGHRPLLAHARPPPSTASRRCPTSAPS
jgi:hypothetical protein